VYPYGTSRKAFLGRVLGVGYLKAKTAAPAIDQRAIHPRQPPPCLRVAGLQARQEAGRSRTWRSRASSATNYIAGVFHDFRAVASMNGHRTRNTRKIEHRPLWHKKFGKSKGFPREDFELIRAICRKTRDLHELHL